MDGVFINLTAKDMSIKIQNGTTVIIHKNPELVTPVKERMYIDEVIHAISSAPLKDNDIHYLQKTNWMNTLYNKITRSEEDIIVHSLAVQRHVKYPFTAEQIEKINYISNGRTRLLVMDEEDAIFWSDGKFECPFRNYRLFSVNLEVLVEHPVPKTYLDLVVNGVKNISKRVY